MAILIDTWAQEVFKPHRNFSLNVHVTSHRILHFCIGLSFWLSSMMLSFSPFGQEAKMLCNMLQEFFFRAVVKKREQEEEICCIFIASLFDVAPDSRGFYCMFSNNQKA